MDRVTARGALAAVALAWTVVALATCLALAPEALAKPSGPSVGRCLDGDGNEATCGYPALQIVHCRGAAPIARRAGASIVRDLGGQLRRVARDLSRRHLCLVPPPFSQPSGRSWWQWLVSVVLPALVGLSFLLALWQWYSARTQDPPIAEELANRYAPGDRVELWARPVNGCGFTPASRLWVATDKRLFLAWRQPRSDTDRLITCVAYRAITAIRKVKADRRGDVTTIVLDLGYHKLEVKLRHKPGKQFLAVLSQQAGLEPPRRRRRRWW